MKTKLDAASLTIIAALALELACASRPAGDGASETGGSESGSSAGSADTSSTSATTGDGETETATGETGETETGGTETGGTEPFACENPVPIMQAGTQIPSGFYECENGFVYRAEAVECDAPQAPDDPACADPDMPCQFTCDAPYGVCVFDLLYGGCLCHVGCATDADCQQGYVCACAGVIGGESTCVPGDCGTNSDCGGGLCGLVYHPEVCGDIGKVGCTTPADECHGDDECSPAPCPDYPENGDVEWYCRPKNEGGWACEADPWCGEQC